MKDYKKCAGYEVLQKLKAASEIILAIGFIAVIFNLYYNFIGQLLLISGILVALSVAIIFGYALMRHFHEYYKE